ncbi:MAG: restriction endonuclease subunit S [Hafnia sp.]
MAKYKAYPEYKDSGVEWLGEIPRHWTLSKFRYNFAFSKGLTITKENLRDEGIPCVNYGEVHSKYGFEVDPRVHTLKCVDEKYLKDNASSLLLNGDIVFADTSEDLEGSGNFTQLISDTRTFAGYHTIISRPFRRGNARFYAYLLDCQQLRTQVRTAVKGVKVFSVTQAILRNLSIWLPSEKEQQRIAAFLDHETAKIDNLIEKQQQLIELLKEKRQAVISHAVTKGLNPDVPMKYSGVEWLGEVPEHWSICRIKQLSLQISKGTTPSTLGGDFVDEGIRFLKAENIGKSKEVNFSPQFYITNFVDKQISRSRLQERDVLVIIAGATTGMASVLQKDLLPANTNQAVSFIRPKNAAFAEWIYYWLGTEFTQSVIWMGAVQAAQPNLSMESLGNIPILVPPQDETKSICLEIEKQSIEFENLISKAELAIELMQERRTALISAAVTGKIDVRDWVAPNACEAEVSQEATA